jgi:hypothetical protein
MTKNPIPDRNICGVMVLIVLPPYRLIVYITPEHTSQCNIAPNMLIGQMYLEMAY